MAPCLTIKTAVVVAVEDAVEDMVEVVPAVFIIADSKDMVTAEAVDGAVVSTTTGAEAATTLDLMADKIILMIRLQDPILLVPNLNLLEETTTVSSSN